MLPSQIPQIINHRKYEIIYVKGETITREIQTIKEVEWYRFRATGYSANDPLQGTTDIMASGKKVYIGSVATDPKIIPIGTRIEIRGLGFFNVEDIGGLIKDNKIDIFCSTKEEALTINKDVWVRIIND